MKLQKKFHFDNSVYFFNLIVFIFFIFIQNANAHEETSTHQISMNKTTVSDFDSQRPLGVSNKMWDELKQSTQHVLLNARHTGIGGYLGKFGSSIAIDGNRALIGGTGLVDTGAVIVMEYDGAHWVETANLQPNQYVQNFGSLVNLSGNHALVSNADLSGNGGVKVFFFEFDGNQWSQTGVFSAELENHPTYLDKFARTISLSGDIAVVGNSNDIINGKRGAGSVYIYQFDGEIWHQIDKLVAPHTEEQGQFGSTVMISRDQIFVSSVGNSRDNKRQGSIYIFNQNGSRWSLSEEIKAEDGYLDDHFGRLIVTDENRMLVAAFDYTTREGSVYVFDFDGTNWHQTAKLSQLDDLPNSTFGIAADLSKDRAVISNVGGLGEDKASLIYVYDFDGINWSLTSTITRLESHLFNTFGNIMNLAHDEILVGFYDDDTQSNSAGSVYVYSFDEETKNWLNSDILYARKGSTYEYFGDNVSLNGNLALISSTGDDEKAPNAGAVYVFEFDGATWKKKTKLMASDGTRFDYFGSSVSFDGHRALIGSLGDESRKGAAYIFDFDGSEWTQTTKLVAMDGESYAEFGINVAIENNRAVITSNYRFTDPEIENSGAVYVYDFDGENWNSGYRLPHQSERDGFGLSVSLSSDQIIVGSPYANLNEGAAYIYHYTNNTWQEAAKLDPPDPAITQHFGNSVSILGDLALVGIERKVTESSLGYLYKHENNSWTKSVTFTDPSIEFIDAHSGTHFHSSWPKKVFVDMIENRIAFGGYGVGSHDSATGGAILFDYDGENWNFESVITANDGKAGDHFGSSLSLSGQRILLGSYGNDDNGLQSGAAYIFGNPLFKLSGTLDGLIENTSLQLEANGSNSLTVTENGDFAFPISLENQLTYSVKVSEQPTAPNQTCHIENGNGQLQGFDIENITVSCVINSYTLSGEINGLANGNSITLVNNDSDQLIINQNGGFTFSEPLEDGTSFTVTLTTQSNSTPQLCSLSTPHGVIAGEDYTQLNINCNLAYKVGGTVQNLDSGNTIKLQNSAGEEILIDHNGEFIFNTVYANGSQYHVRVSQQPTSLLQICTLINESGQIENANVSRIQVLCRKNELGLDEAHGDADKQQINDMTAQLGQASEIPSLNFSKQLVLIILLCFYGLRSYQTKRNKN